MRGTLFTIFLCCIVAIGCDRSEKAQLPQTSNQNISPQTASTPTSSVPNTSPSTNVGSEIRPKTDACALLTSKEIQSIQGEAVKDTKLTGRADGGFVVSQCFFTLPTFSNSISLAVTQKGDAAGARDPREFWRDTFELKKNAEEGERERDRKGESEEEERQHATKVPGVGDEAFWTGSRVGGALYVLKGQSYLRISIGGAADEATKIKRSKALAQKVLARL